MAEVVRMAIVGCGGMAGAHRRGLERLWQNGLRDFLVTAVCDTVPERRQSMAAELAKFQEHKPAEYEQVQQMLDAERDLDAVDICTDHRSHHDLAEACYRAGKHVTIEKPLAITIRAGHRIINAAREAGRLLHVAENYRRSPEERAINWAVKQGRIGSPRMIYWVDLHERRWYWGWRDHKDIAGGGWTLDGGVHFADLFRYHVGEVKTLYAVSRAYDRTRFKDRENMRDPVQATVEDTAIAVLDFENGVAGQWTSSMTAPGHKANLRALYGSEGAIVWGQGLVLRDQSLPMEQLVREHAAALEPEQKELLFPRGITDTIAIELQEFFDAILRGRKVEVDGLEGLKDEAISIAVYESAALGQPVQVSKVESGEVDAYQRELNASLGI